MLISHFLPNSQQLEQGKCTINEEQHQIEVNISSLQQTAICPVCHQPSSRIHSGYDRTLRDLNWADWGVSLRLSVHKFFCDNPLCSRRIFTERLPQLVAPWARRTLRLSQHLTTIGLALAGSAGQRLNKAIGYSFSRDTILRNLAKLPLPPIKTPRAMGVDDFAFRKGQCYGTILVDLDQHCPIALLADREADTLAQWLKEHPGIEILSRDRSKTYRKGMNEGAPNAIQVADRFHLLKNLVEPLETIFGHYPKEIHAASVPPNQASESTIILPPAKAPQLSQQKRNKRQKRYQQVLKLHQQGFSTSAIAQIVKLSPRTVQRYLKCEQAPERQPRSDRGSSPLLDPYKDKLLALWNAGCYNVKELFESIQKQGYKGSYMTVARYVRRLRTAQGLPLRQYPKKRLKHSIVDPKLKPLSAKQAAWLVLRHSQNCTDEEIKQLKRLQSQPHLAPAIALAQDFIEMFRKRLPEQLDQWIQEAQASSYAAFRSFAKGIQDDYDAIKAALILDISNGQTEGQVNRLKMLKRQMFGRAGFKLLQKRVVLAH